jgi:hypothetical protein
VLQEILHALTDDHDLDRGLLDPALDSEQRMKAMAERVAPFGGRSSGPSGKASHRVPAGINGTARIGDRARRRRLLSSTQCRRDLLREALLRALNRVLQRREFLLRSLDVPERCRGRRRMLCATRCGAS